MLRAWHDDGAGSSHAIREVSCPYNSRRSRPHINRSSCRNFICPKLDDRDLTEETNSGLNEETPSSPESLARRHQWWCGFSICHGIHCSWLALLFASPTSVSETAGLFVRLRKSYCHVRTSLPMSLCGPYFPLGIVTLLLGFGTLRKVVLFSIVAMILD